MSYTHVHNIDGEQVTVTGHVNGITIYDSDDEQGQELLDEVFAELYSPVEQYYIVSVSCPFPATSPEDALKQMVAWLDDHVTKAGYRIDNLSTDETVFIDAEKVLQ